MELTIMATKEVLLYKHMQSVSDYKILVLSCVVISEYHSEARMSMIHFLFQCVIPFLI